MKKVIGATHTSETQKIVSLQINFIFSDYLISKYFPKDFLIFQAEIDYFLYSGSVLLRSINYLINYEIPILCFYSAIRDA